MVSSIATAYIYTNKEEFKSNTPGPQGLRGMPGADGTDGVDVTITSVLNNINKSLTINFSDGTQHTTGPLKGEDGRSVTITNVVNNANGTMLINFSDGTSHHTADLRGPIGFKGDTGDHVHHISYQRSKDPLGNEVGPVTPSQKGYTDTYAMWASQEELPEMYIGEFTVYNGLNTLTAEEQVKFESIEFGATADQTGAEIKALYEAELDTNAYTDVSVIKLDVDTALSTTATTLPTAINELVSVKVDKIVGSSLVPYTKVSLYDSHIIDTSNPHVVTKAHVGLSNVDNTSDANKPVSTATQSSLNLKANDNAVVKLTGNQTIVGVKTFSSSPIVPTPTSGDNSTKVATTAFVLAEINKIEEW